MSMGYTHMYSKGRVTIVEINTIIIISVLWLSPLDLSSKYNSIPDTFPVKIPYRRVPPKQWSGVRAYWNVPVRYYNCRCHNATPWRHTDPLTCISESIN